MKTYLFYDLETTGLNKAFDQILQFAAIRTDEEFKELERYNIIVNLRPDVIPSPGASITHRISIAKTKTGVSEYEAVKKIHELINEPDTVSLGYNTLGFDDEFLRISFYRNLLPPYTHQYANGCKRSDLLPLTAIYKLFKPEVIKWPEVNGRPTLKLEHISSLNRLAVGQAHDALVDVEATVELAKKLSTEKSFWDYFEKSFEKQTDIERREKLGVAFESEFGKHYLGLMINAKFGTSVMYNAPVISVGKSKHYSNQNIWIRIDNENLKTVTAENLFKTVYSIRRLDGGIEVLMPYTDKTSVYVDPDRRELMNNNIEWLKNNPEKLKLIVEEFQNFQYDDIKGKDLDSKLYSKGFFTREEEAFSRKFHAADEKEKIELINSAPTEDIKQLATRIIFRNFKSYPDTIKKEFDDFMFKVNPPADQEPLVDHKGEARYTPQMAREEIEQKKENDLDTTQLTLISELEKYLESNFEENKSQLDLF